MSTQLTTLELSVVLDSLDTRIEKIAIDLAASKSVLLEDSSQAENLRREYRDRLIVLRRAREKIMLGGL